MANFTRLEYLIMGTNIGNMDDTSVEEGLRVAGHLFESCSSLRLVSFITFATKSTHGRVSYRRGADGGVSYEGEGILDFFSWRELDI